MGGAPFMSLAFAPKCLKSSLA